jgi:hypothetical protein
MFLDVLLEKKDGVTLPAAVEFIEFESLIHYMSNIGNLTL